MTRFVWIFVFLLFAMIASRSDAVAQSNQVQQIADGLVQFEQHLNWESLDNSWRGRSSGWETAVQAASQPSEVAPLVIELEQAIRWESIDNSWRERSSSWENEMQSAGSEAAVARGLLELERAVLRPSVTGDWGQLRGPWAAKLQAMAGPARNTGVPTRSSGTGTGTSGTRWVSVAASIWKVEGRVHVAIGYSGTRPSETEARDSAVHACEGAGGTTCKPAGAWNSGCAYITTGNAPNRAGWGSGRSPEQALAKCRERDLTCKQPIGGCIQ